LGANIPETYRRTTAADAVEDIVTMLEAARSGKGIRGRGGGAPGRWTLRRVIRFGHADHAVRCATRCSNGARGVDEHLRTVRGRNRLGSSGSIIGLRPPAAALTAA